MPFLGGYLTKQPFHMKILVEVCCLCHHLLINNLCAARSLQGAMFCQIVVWQRTIHDLEAVGNDVLEQKTL